MSIVFIHEVCDKMSNSNIPNPDEENRQLLADYGMQWNEGVMGNVIVHVVNAGDLRGEE